MIIGDIADGLTRGVEATVNSVSEALFEPVVRLGVTGLSRAGKTVFITSLIANLKATGRMPALRAVADGRIETAWLQPQPDDMVPRFDYETHLSKLTGPEPSWPASTTGISELRLSFRIRPGGLLSGLSGPKKLHLDIVDYPGEWLLDLGLLAKSYEEWSEETITRIATREEAADFVKAAQELGSDEPHDEVLAKRIAESFTDALETMRAAGYSNCTPGRFLLPGELKGSPVLTFAPLPEGSDGRGTIRREFRRRFEA